MIEEQPWNFRPTALLKDYKSANSEYLLKHYILDGNRASQNGASVIPPKKTGILRTCQWNIHFLHAPWLGPMGKNDMCHSQEVAKAILDTDSDVIVLNEFGFDSRSKFYHPKEELCKRLESAGHVIHDLAICEFPTAIATRLPTSMSDGFPLDKRRAVVETRVSFLEATTKLTSHIKIFGTHLDDGDQNRGHHRFMEAKNLLSHIDATTDKEDLVLVMADFNQQRCVDYTTEEWESICSNKIRRGSPQDDGVAISFKKSGFQCCYDQPDFKCNWNKDDPPPSTHWSGTVIDYAYSKNMVLDGIYILPYNLSDHRMVVCDWKIPVQDEKK